MTDPNGCDTQMADLLARIAALEDENGVKDAVRVIAIGSSHVMQQCALNLTTFQW